MKRGDIEAALRIVKAHEYDDEVAARKYFTRRARSRKRWQRRDARHWVAVLDGEIVGVSGVQLDDEEGENIWWLSWFYVRARARRRGVGARMFARCTRWAAKQGGRKLFIDTSSTDSFAAARAFYEGRGATQEGRLLDFYEPGDHMVIYGLPLTGK